jgi:ribosomal protein S9
MGRTVSKGADGFFRISGRPETEYFTDEHHAQRIAANLDVADAEEHADAAERDAPACSDADLVDAD